MPIMFFRDDESDTYVSLLIHFILIDLKNIRVLKSKSTICKWYGWSIVWIVSVKDI